MENKTCAFVSMRQHHLPFGFNEEAPGYISLMGEVREKVVGLIENDGVTGFISAMSMGFSLSFAELVLSLKERYPQITLEAAIPNKEQDLLWPQAYRDRYRAALEKCGSVYGAFDEHTEGDGEARDRYMLDNCDVLLVVWNGEKGNAAEAAQFVKERGREVVIISPAQ